MRAAGRRMEMDIRLALGAGRSLSRAIELDPFTVAVCSTVLLATALGASYWPAVWAATVPPQEALKDG